MVERLKQVRLEMGLLPRECPSCRRRVVWGWMDEEMADPVFCADGAEIHIARIPRPDRTLQCPACAEAILN